MAQVVTQFKNQICEDYKRQSSNCKDSSEIIPSCLDIHALGRFIGLVDMQTALLCSTTSMAMPISSTNASQARYPTMIDQVNAEKQVRRILGT